MMAHWSWLYGLVAALYSSLGIWVFLRQKNPVHGIYGILCVLTAAWQIIWILVSKPTLSAFDIQSIYILHSAILFIPAVLYHFILKFTGNSKTPVALVASYACALFFTVLIWTTSWFFNGFHDYPWGRSLKAGVLHPVFSILVCLVVARIFYLLMHYRLAQINADTKRRQARWVIAATAIYCGGALDLLSNYGISFFPLSFFFCGVSLGLFSYAIFRYEFLAIALPRENETDRVRRESASSEMRRLGMAAAFPLVSQGELLGFLLLGEKMSEEAYSKEDLLLLRIVANQAALGYQRVRFLEMAVHGARTEMLGEIAGGFAHEIKTPLANISLPAELSLMDLIDVEKGKRNMADVLPELKSRLKDIMTQAFKASEKIEAIRQFSKPGLIKLAPVELVKIFQNSLGLLDHVLKKHHVRIVTHFPAMMPPVRGDAKQLEIVFVNLIKNAAEAMAQNVSSGLARELVLSGHEESDWVIATVKDSGPGIKRADFGHLFEAYFTTKGSEGTGMGLFLSHQVIKAHGGAIDCRSEEGQGTEFVIRLPKFSDEHMGVKAA